MRLMVKTLAVWFMMGLGSQGEASSAFTPAQSKELREIVRQEIKAALGMLVDPSSGSSVQRVVQKALTRYMKHLQESLGVAFVVAAEGADKEMHQMAALQKHKAALFASPDHPFIGDATATKVALIFTDPYCAHCHEALNDFEAYTQKNPKVRLIIHNYPLFGKGSQEAVRAFLAAHLQKKYTPFYKAFRIALETRKKLLSQEDLLKIAADLKIDTAQFQKDFNSEQTQKLLKETIRLGEAFKVTGTPTFITQEVSGKDKNRVIEGMATPQECFDGVAVKK